MEGGGGRGAEGEERKSVRICCQLGISVPFNLNRLSKIVLKEVLTNQQENIRQFCSCSLQVSLEKRTN